MVAGPQLEPSRHPSDWDVPAPIGRPRRLAREKWMPRESALPANRDKELLALPAAVTGRVSAAGTLFPEQTAPVQARLDRPPSLAPQRRRAAPTTAGKAVFVPPFDAQKARRRG